MQLKVFDFLAQWIYFPCKYIFLIYVNQSNKVAKKFRKIEIFLFLITSDHQFHSWMTTIPNNLLHIFLKPSVSINMHFCLFCMCIFFLIYINGIVLNILLQTLLLSVKNIFQKLFTLVNQDLLYHILKMYFNYTQKQQQKLNFTATPLISRSNYFKTFFVCSKFLWWLISSQ